MPPKRANPTTESQRPKPCDTCNRDGRKCDYHAHGLWECTRCYRRQQDGKVTVPCTSAIGTFLQRATASRPNNARALGITQWCDHCADRGSECSWYENVGTSRKSTAHPNGVARFPTDPERQCRQCAEGKRECTLNGVALPNARRDGPRRVDAPLRANPSAETRAAAQAEVDTRTAALAGPSGAGLVRKADKAKANPMGQAGRARNATTRKRPVTRGLRGRPKKRQRKNSEEESAEDSDQEIEDETDKDEDEVSEDLSDVDYRRPARPSEHRAAKKGKETEGSKTRTRRNMVEGTKENSDDTPEKSIDDDAQAGNEEASGAETSDRSPREDKGKGRAPNQDGPDSLDAAFGQGNSDNDTSENDRMGDKHRSVNKSHDSDSDGSEPEDPDDDDYDGGTKAGPSKAAETSTNKRKRARDSGESDDEQPARAIKRPHHVQPQEVAGPRSRPSVQPIIRTAASAMGTKKAQTPAARRGTRRAPARRRNNTGQPHQDDVASAPVAGPSQSAPAATTQATDETNPALAASSSARQHTEERARSPEPPTAGDPMASSDDSDGDSDVAPHDRRRSMFFPPFVPMPEPVSGFDNPPFLPLPPGRRAALSAVPNLPSLQYDGSWLTNTPAMMVSGQPLPFGELAANSYIDSAPNVGSSLYTVHRRPNLAALPVHGVRPEAQTGTHDMRLGNYPGQVILASVPTERILNLPDEDLATEAAIERSMDDPSPFCTERTPMRGKDKQYELCDEITNGRCEDRRHGLPGSILVCQECDVKSKCIILGGRNREPAHDIMKRVPLMRGYWCVDCNKKLANGDIDQTSLPGSGTRVYDLPEYQGLYECVELPRTQHSQSIYHGGYADVPQAYSGCACIEKLLNRVLCRVHRLGLARSLDYQAKLMREWQLTVFGRLQCPSCLQNPSMEALPKRPKMSTVAWNCLICHELVVCRNQSGGTMHPDLSKDKPWIPKDYVGWSGMRAPWGEDL